MKLRVVQIIFSSIIVAVVAYINFEETRLAAGCDPCYFANTILPTLVLVSPILWGFLFLVVSEKVYKKYKKIQSIYILFFIILIVSYIFSNYIF